MTAGPRLAVEGGPPVRSKLLPYGRQTVSEADIAAVAEVLRSDWLTTGPMVAEFERAFALRVGAGEAVAVSNGTAGLHAAMYALGIGPGDTVLVPPLTFAASANCVVYQGGTPVFTDVDPETLLLDPNQVEKQFRKTTRAIIAVDYAGHPCDYDALSALADAYQVPLVADACHAVGGRYRDRNVGSLATLSVFSFHPVKHLTTGEGGMITTDNPELARKMRTFRNHAITTDARQREQTGSWFYEMVDLGFNYRLTDFQCALGLSQLARLDEWVARRREVAHRYDAALAEFAEVTIPRVAPQASHAYHLYPILLNLDRLRVDRGAVFAALRAENIGVNVHYIPVHLHPFYRQRFGTHPGMCPVSEAAYDRLLSLPIFPGMSDADADDVVAALAKVFSHYRR